MTDNATPISRFPVPGLETLPEDIRKVVEANAAKAGFTPNVFLAYGTSRSTSAPSSTTTTC